VTRPKTIAVVGPGEGAREPDVALGFELGKLIAERGWILLSGGRAAGVMDGVNRGAKAAGGLTVGIVPRTGVAISEAVDIPIITDMGDARNNIIVLTGDVIISCGVGGAGTASEIALALKAGKHVVLLGASEEARSYFKTIGRHLVHVAATPAEAVEVVAALFAKS
jgi:uncharacterized protein (TIGR00725 family)